MLNILGLKLAKFSWAILWEPIRFDEICFRSSKLVNIDLNKKSPLGYLNISIDSSGISNFVLCIRKMAMSKRYSLKTQANYSNFFLMVKVDSL